MPCCQGTEKCQGNCPHPPKDSLAGLAQGLGVWDWRSGHKERVISGPTALFSVMPSSQISTSLFSPGINPYNGPFQFWAQEQIPPGSSGCRCNCGFQPGQACNVRGKCGKCAADGFREPRGTTAPSAERLAALRRLVAAKKKAGGKPPAVQPPETYETTGAKKPAVQPQDTMAATAASSSGGAWNGFVNAVQSAVQSVQNQLPPKTPVGLSGLSPRGRVWR